MHETHTHTRECYGANTVRGAEYHAEDGGKWEEYEPKRHTYTRTDKTWKFLSSNLWPSANEIQTTMTTTTIDDGLRRRSEPRENNVQMNLSILHVIQNQQCWYFWTLNQVSGHGWHTHTHTHWNTDGERMNSLHRVQLNEINIFPGDLFGIFRAALSFHRLRADISWSNT